MGQYISDPIDLRIINSIKMNMSVSNDWSFSMTTKLNKYNKNKQREWTFKCQSSNELIDWMTVLRTFQMDQPPPNPFKTVCVI